MCGLQYWSFWQLTVPSLSSPAHFHPTMNLCTHTPIPRSLLKRAADKLKKWRDGLAAGDVVDIFEAPFETWYTAKILTKTGTNMSIKYFGFSGKGELATMDVHDPAFSVSPALSKVVTPNMRWGGVKGAREQWEFYRNLVPAHMQASWAFAHPAPTEEKEVAPEVRATNHQ